MRLRKISEFLLTVYGVTTAVDKLTTFLQNEKDFEETKRHKKLLKKHRLHTDYERITFHDKDAAYDALDKMKDIVCAYGYATVSDFYEINGEVPTVFDTKIGWKTLYDDEVKIKRYKDGFKIVFPRPTYITRSM